MTEEKKEFHTLRVKVTQDNETIFESMLMKNNGEGNYLFRETRGKLAYPLTSIKLDTTQTTPMHLAARMIQGSVNFETKKSMLRPEVEAMLNRVLGGDADDGMRQEAVDACMEILSREKSKRRK